MHADDYEHDYDYDYAHEHEHEHDSSKGPLRWLRGRVPPSECGCNLPSAE